MEHIMDYVKPELVIVAIVLYFLGMWLKQAAFIKDEMIPMVLGAAGIFVCAIWISELPGSARGRMFLWRFLQVLRREYLWPG